MLLQRLYPHVGGTGFLVSLPPIRQPKHRLLRRDETARAVQLAALRLSFVKDPTARRLVLVLVDADEDRACELGPHLLQLGRDASPATEVACVVATVEYETWFVASAESLGEFLDLREGTGPSDDPESARHGKGWIESRFRGPKYSETIDQRRMTAAMDLALCRRRSPSFDKLCREIEARAACV